MDGSAAPALAVPEGRIGPNAITRVAEALRRTMSVHDIDALFREAGLLRYRFAPPERMVAEREVAALHRTLRARLPPDRQRAVLREAGALTAGYLLAQRIPRAVQVVLRALPAPLAARLLLGAIRRHAWTFAGSGHFAATAGATVRLSIAGCPLCHAAQAKAPACDYFAAIFERLFARLVHPRATVREIACEAMGDPACRFEVAWRPGP